MVSILAAALLLCLSCTTVSADPKTDPFLYEKFDADFAWGTATASYQVEGAWNVSGKGENIWDEWTHEGGHVVNNDTGDVTCDSYNKYKADVQLMKNIGVSHYRFSVSWSRIFPSGTNESYTPAGMTYYKNLIKELKANNITPMVTLFHWDLPQPLEDEGGWLNDTIIDKFNSYADKVFSELGANVPLWITFNEPWTFCNLGYGTGGKAPGISDQPGVYPYQCVHNVIRSHAKAYRTYNTTYRATQKGKISLATNIDHEEPATDTQKDKDAADRAYQFMLGWFAHPIYKDGDYPQVMKERIANKSAAQNLPKSRLPVFTDQEKKMIKGTYDFFGLNHYTTHLVSNNVSSMSVISYANDQDLSYVFDPAWPSSGSSWLKACPWGLRKNLVWIKQEYGDLDVYITENGVSDKSGTLDDPDRVSYYNTYINNVLKAIKRDKVKVKGYFAWSLMDNFEWARGYSEKFGLHQVNFTDPNRPRVPKKSALWYKELIRENGWNNPPTTQPSITSTSRGAAMLSSLGMLSITMMPLSSLW